MGAGASCRKATATVAPTPRGSHRPASGVDLVSALPDEVGPDPEFAQRARWLAAEDPCPDLRWSGLDGELVAREGISPRTAAYVAEALGAGTLVGAACDSEPLQVSAHRNVVCKPSDHIAVTTLFVPVKKIHRLPLEKRRPTSFDSPPQHFCPCDRGSCLLNTF